MGGAGDEKGGAVGVRVEAARVEAERLAAEKEAAALVDAAHANYTAVDDQIGLAKVLIDRGILQLRRGAHSAGIADLDRAESLLRADGGSYDIDLARIASARAAAGRKP